MPQSSILTARGAWYAAIHDMRQHVGIGVATVLLLAVGCGTSEKPGSAGNTTSTATPSTTPPASTAEKASTTAITPITGKTITVNMLGDAKGYRYEPSTITLKPGDGIKFINVSGGPHNVAFWPDSIPSGAQQALQADMPNTTAPLTGPLLTAPNATYTISFAGQKPGVYRFYCTVHLALGMKGTLRIQ